MTGLEIAALRVLTIRDSERLWKFRRHTPKPIPVDIVVLHPNFLDGVKHRDEKEYPIFTGLHATLAGVNYICRLAHLAEDRILTVAESGYTEEQIQEWLLAGHDTFPYLKDVPMAIAGTQLKIAVVEQLSRKF